MTDASWSAATFEGSAQATAAATAKATPEQRMDWLDEALAVALAAGTLDHVRRRRQLAVDAVWGARGGTRTRTPEGTGS